METKHTKGKWVQNGINGVHTINGSCIAIAEQIGDEEQIQANAKLIAEAGNVTNESGLTPRQLLEQRNEMLDALEFYRKGIEHFYDCINFKQSNLDSEAISFMNESNIKIREAIRKVAEK
jgi:hypothetical protein